MKRNDSNDLIKYFFIKMSKVSRAESKVEEIMAGVFCVLLFELLIAAVVVNTTTASSKQLDAANGDLSSRDSLDEVRSCEFFPILKPSGNPCDIWCWCVGADILSTKVEAAIANDDSNCSSIGYHLRYDEPLISSLRPGWLKTNAAIRKITIRDAVLNRLFIDIQPGAFNDCTFRKMTELVIRDTHLTVLKKGVFEGASSLKKLTINDNVSMRTIEESTLDPLYQLEEIKMTNQPHLENLFNLTGSTQLKHLSTLTLNSNKFISSIDAETFKGCISVESINLSTSSIETIGFGTFDHMAATIRYLDLRDNKLTHLPSNLLAPLSQPDIEIFLSNNPWHCDCDSVELQLWSTSNSDVIADWPLVCDMPEMVKGKNIGDVDLTSTFRPPFAEYLKCVNEKYVPSGTIYLGKVYQYFNIKQVEVGTVSVEISEPDHDSSLSMVVINDKDDIECRYNVSRKMTFNNLDSNAAHLFCLIRKTSEAASPRNCYPFHFDETKSIWGHDEIIIALVCSIVLSLVVGVLCGGLLILWYQRVFNAKESQQFGSSSRTSDYFDGRYGSVNKGANAKRLRRTYSENSVASCKSYLTAITPSPFEIMQNAVNSNDRCTNYMDKIAYDCLPPPIPPYSNRRKSDVYETIAEPGYLCPFPPSEIDPYSQITYGSR